MENQFVTAVLVASPKEDRYSNQAVRLLHEKGYAVIPVGYRKGWIEDIEIIPGQPKLADIHTLSLYLNPRNQVYFYDYILSLNPKRVLFNPGTENPELQTMLTEHGIFWEEACTLVLLRTKQYDE